MQFTAKWADVYHHLLASGVPMVVRGAPLNDGQPCDWLATPLGLNRYNGAECTATWHPSSWDVLETPMEIPALTWLGGQKALQRLHDRVREQMAAVAKHNPHCEAVDALDWVLQRLDEEMGQ